MAESLIAVPPAPGIDGTTLSVTPGSGAAFGDAPFFALVWPAGAQPTTFNAEGIVVMHKGLSGDDWQVIRRHKASKARDILTGDQIVQIAAGPIQYEIVPLVAPAFVTIGVTLAQPRVHDVRYDLDT